MVCGPDRMQSCAGASGAAMYTRSSVAVLLGYLLLLAAYGLPARAQHAKPGPAAMAVTAAEVTRKPLARLIAVTGTIVAWEQLPIGAEASGLAIQQVLVEEGDIVKKGQVLVRLNDDVLQAQLKRQDAAIAEARAALKEAQANLNRTTELRRSGWTSAQTADARRAAVETAAARLASAEAAKAEIEAKLAQTIIRSPADGYVSKKTALIGQVVSTGQELVRIVRDSRLELDAEVPEADIPLIKAGQTAQVAADNIAPVTAKVRSVAPAVDAKTRLGIAHIALPAGRGFKPGMFARAEITIEDAVALVIPQRSIIWRDGKSGAFVIDAEGKVDFRPVEAGSRSGGDLEIRAGLKEGERIAVKGAGFLESGDRVRVADEADFAGQAATVRETSR